MATRVLLKNSVIVGQAYDMLIHILHLDRTNFQKQSWNSTTDFTTQEI